MFLQLFFVLDDVGCVFARWMRVRAHPTYWTNILEKKMSILIEFERLNVRMPI